jgi:tyrosinase
VLFLTWHRPYLALFEQVLASHCQAIVATYPPDEVPIYQAAANNFRIPYWDWASNTTLPSVVNADTITITTPSGVQSVPNPLLNYTWQTFQERQSWFPTNQSESNEFLYDAYLAEYRQTVRGALTPGGPGNWVNSDQMMRQYPYMQMTVSPSPIAYRQIPNFPFNALSRANTY